MGENTKTAKKYKAELTITSEEKDCTNSDLAIIEYQETVQLATIFPAEVWLLILLDKDRAERQHGTNTVTNVSLASPYFRNLLANQRKFFLFPNVLEILTTWVENQDTQIGTSSEQTSTRAEVPACHSRLQLTDLLICREVCPQWNHDFEHFHQSPLRYAHMKHDQIKSSRNLCEIKMNFQPAEQEEDEEQLDNLHQNQRPSLFFYEFQDTHVGPSMNRNPFPGRSLKFGDLHLEDFGFLQPRQDIFGHGITLILALYGEHLWHCDMKLTDMNFNNRNEFYRKLDRWLMQMPNLKTMKLNCEHVFEAGQMDITDELFDQMEAEIKRNRLSVLKNLEFFQVVNLAPVIFNEIIKRSGQKITQLEIVRQQEADYAVDYDIYSEAQALFKLKELSINFCSAKQFERMERSVVAANWKLEKFYFLYDQTANFLDWSRVFRMIGNNWSNSLTNLVLKMPVLKSKANKFLGLEATLSRSVLQLPYIKRVKLIVRDPCSLDFLLPSKNTLECLEVIADYNVDTAKERSYYQMLQQRQCVKFLGFENSKQIVISNILDKFPDLNFLRIVTRLNREKTGSNYWYRFCISKAGLMQMEDRLEYPANLL